MHALASESVVLETLGYEVEHRPGAGEAVFISEGGDEVLFEQVTPPTHRPCIFEFVYFARPDSNLDGMSVYRVREGMGRALARKIQRLGLEIDAVVPVPESARAAAIEMSRELGLPLREALVKNRYVGRTFIMPGAGERRRSVRHKLNVIASEVAGRSVLLVDDSIVRGTTSREIVEMLRQAGAKKVYLASTAPPLRHPCVYGIDMSTRREFIARDRNYDEIARILGAEAVIYQDLEDLIESARQEHPGTLEDTCHACFSGHYPTGDIDAEALEGGRAGAAGVRRLKGAQGRRRGSWGPLSSRRWWLPACRRGPARFRPWVTKKNISGEVCLVFLDGGAAQVRVPSVPTGSGPRAVRPEKVNSR
ncbi:MAG: amidophosphoribosyltransferase [Acidobacteriota bacterium]|nr:amidophosphoribosyltransferase [Acidobacteriota bacterium]